MIKTANVFIVEDDKFLSPLLRSRLEKEGLTVLQAFDGEEALRALETTRPQVIIMDLIMPRVSGLELLEMLSSDPQYNQIPVIIMSNLSQESDVEKAKRLGAVGYFVKVNASLDEVIKLVKQLMAKAGPATPAAAPTATPAPPAEGPMRL